MFIRNLIDYVRIKKIIKKVIREENLLYNLSNLFSTKFYKVNFKQDWIGRIYAVINPAVQDPQARIFEYDEEGMNMNSYVNKWIMEHMIAADNFVKNHELFDILTYNFEQLDDDYNFLFTLTPIAWFDFWTSTKRVLWITLALVVIGITLLVLL